MLQFSVDILLFFTHFVISFKFLNIQIIIIKNITDIFNERINCWDFCSFYYFLLGFNLIYAVFSMP